MAGGTREDRSNINFGHVRVEIKPRPLVWQAGALSITLGPSGVYLVLCALDQKSLLHSHTFFKNLVAIQKSIKAQVYPEIESPKKGSDDKLINR